MHLTEKIEHENYEELMQYLVQLHENQFLACGLPRIHWRDLCMKLKDEVYLSFLSYPYFYLYGY